MKLTVWDLYFAPINVWVEDNLTRAVLDAVWGDPKIHLMAAGGVVAVNGLVTETPPRLRGSVFGLLDGDFRPDKTADWWKADCRVLKLPVHEFENLLLRFDVLAAVAGTSKPAQIESVARDYARSAAWWMACKATLWTMNNDLGAIVPADPGVGAVTSETAALEVITKAAVWTAHPGRRALWTDAKVQAELATWKAIYDAELVSTGWTDSFSGKEIFRHLRGHVRGLDAVRPQAGMSAPPSLNSAEHDEDLGKRMARENEPQGPGPCALQGDP